MREGLRRIGVAHVLGRGWGEVKELTHGLNRLRAIAAGEQSIVTDAMETPEEDVGEEAAVAGRLGRYQTLATAN